MPRRQRPPGYLTETEYQAQVKLSLERIYGEVSVQWSALRGQGRNTYAPRVDVAVGPFAIHRRYIEEYTNLLNVTRPFIESLLVRHNRNAEGIGQPVTFGDILHFNDNARCLISIEIEECGGRKHCLGNLVNVSSLGRVGILVARTDAVLRTFIRQRSYFQFLEDVGKNTFKTANALVLSERQFDECLREIPLNPQENREEPRHLQPPQDFA
jgi:hypothetical protein